MMGLLLDFRYALRNLIKSLSFTLLILFIMVGSLTISLIGFNYIHTIAFSHTSFTEIRDDIRILNVKNAISNQQDFTVEMHEGLIQLEEVKALTQWLAIKRTQFWLSNGIKSDHFRGSYVEASFFDFLGQQPELGRGFIKDDFRPGAPNVMVISHIVWQQFYQGQDDVIGKQLSVQGQPYEIIGVMPKRNHFPIFSKVWLPLKFNNLTANDTFEI